MSDKPEIKRVFIGDSASLRHLEQEMLQKSTTVGHLAEAFQPTPQPQQQAPQPAAQQPAAPAKDD